MPFDNLKMRTLVKYPFLGSVIAGLPLIECDSTRGIKTAATNGKEVFINTKFYDKLSKAEQIFLYAHELLHIAFDHISRCGDKDDKLWNTATDAVINDLLKKDGLPMIDGGVEIQDAFSKTAEKVYEELLKKQREKKNNQQQQQNSGKGNQQNSGNGNQNQKQQNSGNGNQKEQQNSNNSQNDNDQVGHDTHTMWKDAVKNKIDEAQLKQYAEIIKRTIMAGNFTSSIARAITDSDAKQLIDWKYLLRQSIKKDIDWSYQNAEFDHGVLCPKLEHLPYCESEVLIDTSGSISNEQIKVFLGEVKKMLKTSVIKVGCFDTKFYGFQKIDDFRAVGGGGTDFDVAVDAFTRNSLNKIIFTDGYADMPQKMVRAIWVVFGDNEIKPNGGRVINISEEQIRKMQLLSNEKEM